MAWSSIIGQEAIKRFFQQAVRQQRISPAYCLWGPEGVGKDALALEFAKLLNCRAPRHTDGGLEACDTCPDCRQASRLEHPAIRFVFALPPPKSRTEGPPLLGLSDDQIGILREELRRKADNPYYNIRLPNALQISIGLIRDIQRTLAMAPPAHGRRVIILSEADRMTAEAANACLKTLEEPQDDVVFILTSSRRDLLPSTILSRCYQLYCPPLPDEVLIPALCERHGITEAEARIIAALAHGSYAQALLALETELPSLRQHALDLLRVALKPRRFRQELLHRIEELAGTEDRTRVEQLLKLLLLWLRDAFVLQHTGSTNSLANVDHTETLRRFLQRFPQADLPAMMAAVDTALSLLPRYVNAPLLLLTTLLQCRSAANPSLHHGAPYALPATL